MIQPFSDSETDEVKGYGQLDSDMGFVGEIYVPSDENDPTNTDILYMTPQEEIDTALQAILDDPDSFPPSTRPHGKY